MYLCHELPESRKYHYVKKKDRGLDYSYVSYEFLSYKSQQLPTIQISSIELLNLKGQLGHTYFSNPARLDLVESKFGFKQRKNS